MAKKVMLQNGQTRWRERVSVNGIRKTITARTREELTNLVNAEKERERRRKLGIAEPTGDITYGELAQKLLDRYMKRASSKQFLEWFLGYSLSVFETWKVREITTEDVEDWLMNLRGKRGGELSPKTKRHALGVVRQVLNYGIDREYLSKNVARKVTAPAENESDSAQPFESWEEVEKVAKALGSLYDRGYQLVMFVAATGLRTQEWQVLRWSDFDLSVPQVFVGRTNQQEGEKAVGKTKASLAPVLLQERALAALRELPRPVTGDELLFPAPEGGVWNLRWFRRGVWKQALADAGVEYRGPYQLRHTFATLALEAAVPLEWISKQLRHTKIEQTRKAYARWTKKADTHWLDVLNSAGQGDQNRLGDLLERLG